MIPPMRALAFLLILLSCLSVFAEPVAGRGCRILFLDGPDSAPENLVLFDGVSSREVELPRMNFSPVYPIRAGAISLALLPGPPAAPANADAPRAIPAGAPAVAIAATITDFYLILTSDPSNRIAPVRMQVIDADAANFKRGQMLWFNLTDSKVGGIVGASKLLIQPNSRLILGQPATKQEDYHVNIHFQPPGGTRAEPLCETRWTHDPRSRSVFFILKPAGARIPRILGFPDFRGEVGSKPESGQ